MSSFIAWNCRGLRKRGARDRIRYAISEFKLPLFMLVETHATKKRSRTFLRSLGRNWTGVAQPGTGRAGGLLAAWQPALLDVTLLLANESLLHLLVTNDSRQSWLLTLVYASTSEFLRNDLWLHLSSLDLGDVPWQIIGDFNCILGPSDKIGGRSFVDSTSVRAFHSMIFQQGFYDLGFQGPGHTWCNNRVLNNRICSRLDRSFGNSAFMALFPNCSIQHLVRTGSDHNPLYFKANGFTHSGSRRFRFEHFWLQSPDLGNLIDKAMEVPSSHPAASPPDILSSKLLVLQSILTSWNYSSFGCIETRISEVVQQIAELEKSSSQGLSIPVTQLRSLYNLHLALLRQQSLKWSSKAGLMWMSLGDTNSKFFYRAATVRRRRNFIACLKTGSGLSLSCTQDIAAEFASIYQSLWDSPSSMSGILPTLPAISNLASLDLLNIPSQAEVLKALHSLPDGKAPGPDGYHADFFRVSWNRLGPLTVKAIQHFFMHNYLPPSWGDTFICFIPKITAPSEPKDYRPISLCNSVYRLLAKLLVRRMAPLMHSIIDPAQSAFLKGRSSTDNIILIREVLHTMHAHRRFKRHILIKLDIEKAFDSVSRSAIIAIMESMGFPIEFCYRIYSCISSPRFACFVNGSTSRWFSARRGIRQGDPLSPFLFLMVMQVFSSLMNKAVDNGQITPFSCADFKISHSLFADDVMVMIRGNKRSISALKNLLHSFRQLTGLRINSGKSAVYFSKWAEPSFMHSVSSQLSISKGIYPFRYLGTMLSQSWPKVKDYSFLIENIRNRLAGWKASSLSQAGRMVLVQHVLQATPVHNMIAGWIPRTVISKIEMLFRSFLWSGGQHRGLHLVRWNSVALPKRLGGLGLKDMEIFSYALLGPVVYKLLNSQDIPWVHLMRAKYGNICSAMRSSSSIVKRSPFWKHCCATFGTINSKFEWQLGSGANTKVLSDAWLFDIPIALKPTFISLLPALDDVPVNYFLNNGGWDLHKLELYFHPLMVNRIVDFKSSLAEDRWVWNPSPSGKAKPASVYGALISDGVIHANRKAYHSLWKLKVNPKVKCFLWKFLHGALPTREFLFRRHMGDSNSCQICGAVSEDILHALFTCPVAAAVWRFFFQFFPRIRPSVFSIRSFWNLICDASETSAASIAAFTAWSIWTNRNAIIHHESGMATICIWAKCLAYYDAHAQGLTSERASFITPDRSFYAGSIREGWSSPQMPFLKINVDAALSSTDGSAGGGWICRDSFGVLVRAVGFRFHQPSPIIAEAEVFVAAIRAAMEMGWKRVWIETDSLALFQSISAYSDGEDLAHWALYPYVSTITSLRSNFDNLFFDWINRTANRSADWLAHLALSRGDFVILPYDVPHQLEDLLLSDVNGTVDPVSTF